MVTAGPSFLFLVKEMNISFVLSTFIFTRFLLGCPVCSLVSGFLDLAVMGVCSTHFPNAAVIYVFDTVGNRLKEGDRAYRRALRYSGIRLDPLGHMLA